MFGEQENERVVAALGDTLYIFSALVAFSSYSSYLLSTAPAFFGDQRRFLGPSTRPQPMKGAGHPSINLAQMG